MRTEFDPYQALLDLQLLQHQQAENMVKVSEWMVEVSDNVKFQQKQINAMFAMLEGLNNIGQINDKRLTQVERAVLHEHK